MLLGNGVSCLRNEVIDKMVQSIKDKRQRNPMLHYDDSKDYIQASEKKHFYNGEQRSDSEVYRHPDDPLYAPFTLPPFLSSLNNHLLGSQ